MEINTNSIVIKYFKLLILIPSITLFNKGIKNNKTRKSETYQYALPVNWNILEKNSLNPNGTLNTTAATKPKTQIINVSIHEWIPLFRVEIFYLSISK